MEALIGRDDAEAQLTQEILDRRKLLALSRAEQKDEIGNEITVRLNRLKKLRTQRRCDSCGERIRHERDLYVIQCELGYKIECYDCVAKDKVPRLEPIVGEAHESYELCVADRAYTQHGATYVVVRCEKCGLSHEYPKASLEDHIFVCDGTKVLWYRAKAALQTTQ